MLTPYHMREGMTIRYPLSDGGHIFFQLVNNPQVLWNGHYTFSLRSQEHTVIHIEVKPLTEFDVIPYQSSPFTHSYQ